MKRLFSLMIAIILVMAFSGCWWGWGPDRGGHGGGYEGGGGHEDRGGGGGHDERR